MTPDERAQKAAAKLIAMGADITFKMHPRVPDRLKGLRATDPSYYPPLPVATLLERGPDTLPVRGFSFSDDCPFPAPKDSVVDNNSLHRSSQGEFPVKRSPWTPEEVAALQRRQTSLVLHPYTCKTHSTLPLVPTESGWQCAVCLYHQDWAFVIDLDGSMDGDPFEMRGL